MNRRNFLCSSWVVAMLGFTLVVASPLVAAEAAVWKEFAPKEAKFSVQFPAKTTSGTTGSGKAESGKDEYKTERCILNGTAYTLYWKVRDEPFANEAGKDAYLRGQQNAMAKNGKLISDGEVTVGGIKGKEFIVTVDEKTTLRARAFVIDRVCCTLVVQGSSPDAVKAADPETFFQSFKPTPAAPAERK